MTTIDDNTLDNAGEVGRDLADSMSAKIIETLDGFPASSPAQRAAIARIVANSLYDYSDEAEPGVRVVRDTAARDALARIADALADADEDLREAVAVLRGVIA